VLGKLLLKQKQYGEARKLYADTTATCGQNAHARAGLEAG
jgi:hypothetical protein